MPRQLGWARMSAFLLCVRIGAFLRRNGLRLIRSSGSQIRTSVLGKSMPIEIQEERPSDIAAIRDVNRRAFGQDQEANIVDALRSNGGSLLSLVASLNGRVVGHIMYSPITVRDVTGAALGPMAVLPEYQRQAIGTKLVETGNEKLKAAGYPFIIVVGHPDYYPGFGFTPASAHGITC